MLARERSDISLTRLQGNPSAVAGMDVTITSATDKALPVYLSTGFIIGRAESLGVAFHKRRSAWPPSVHKDRSPRPPRPSR